MFKQLAIFCLFATVISASQIRPHGRAHLKDNRNVIEDAIRQFLATLQESIPDPLEVANLELNPDWANFSGHAEINLLNLAGLSAFEIQKLEVSGILNYKLSLILNWADINFHTGYNMDLTVLDNAVTGDGSLDWDITDLNVEIGCKIQLLKEVTPRLSVEDFKITIKVGTISFTVTGFMLDEDLSAQISQFITDNAANLINDNADLISNVLSSFIQSILDNILNLY